MIDWSLNCYHWYRMDSGCHVKRSSPFASASRPRQVIKTGLSKMAAERRPDGRTPAAFVVALSGGKTYQIQVP